MGKTLCHKIEKRVLLLSHTAHKHFDYHSTLKGCFNLKLFKGLPGMILSMISPLYKTSGRALPSKGQESVLLCYLRPSDKTKRNVEDVKQNPRPEALTNSLKKPHSVLRFFLSPTPLVFIYSEV